MKFNAEYPDGWPFSVSQDDDDSEDVENIVTKCQVILCCDSHESEFETEKTDSKVVSKRKRTAKESFENKFFVENQEIAEMKDFFVKVYGVLNTISAHIFDFLPLVSESCTVDVPAFCSLPKIQTWLREFDLFIIQYKIAHEHFGLNCGN